MAFQAAPDIAQVILRGSVDNQLTVNDMYFFSSGGVNIGNLDALTTALAVWASSNLCPLLSDDWTLVDAHGVDLTSQTGPVADASVGVAGGVSGEANPNNVAACISFRTAQRGRSGRGRNYLPGIPGSLVTLNTLDPDWMASVVAIYQDITGAGTLALGWEWVVLSRVFEGAPRTVGIGLPVVNAKFTTNTVRSMRSREVGHGA